MVQSILTALISIILGYFLPGFCLSYLAYGRRQLAPPERIVLSAALSVGLLFAVMYALGITTGFGALNSTSILLIISAAAFWPKRSEILSFGGDLLAYCRNFLDEMENWEKWAVLAIGFQILFAFYYSLGFPIDGGDALAIHAPLSKLYAGAGRLVQTEGTLSVYDPLPHGFHLFISWFYLLNGFNDVFARLAAPIFFLLAIRATYFLSNRVGGRQVALLSALIFAFTPLALAHSQIYYLNLPEAFFISAGLLALLLAFQSKKEAHFLAAGFIGGAAVLLKPTSISFALLAIALTAYFLRSKALRPLLALGLGAILSLSPIWLASNLQTFLSPSSNFFFASPEVVIPFARYFTFPLLDNEVAVNQGVGPFFITFGLIGVWHLYTQRRRAFPQTFALSALALLLLIAEIFLLKQGARFVLQLAPLLAIFSAYGMSRLLEMKNSTARTLAIALIVLSLLPSLVLAFVGFKSAHISYETNTLVFNFYFPPPSTEKFLADAYGSNLMDGIAWLNSNAPTGQKVLVNVPLTYFIKPTSYSFYELRFYNRTDSLLSFMRAQSICHVAIMNADQPEFEGRGTLLYSMLSNTAYFEKEFENERVIIYKNVQC